MKIFISPSSQIHNVYAAMSTTEASVCYDIACQLKSILSESFDVGMETATSTIARRVESSNQFGADYHICIHTNAGSSAITGTLVMCYPGRQSDPVVQAVYRHVASLTPSVRDQGIRQNGNLIETRQPKAITVYVEVDYHSNEDMAQWLVSHTEQIAQAIAAGVAEGTGIEIPSITRLMSGQDSSAMDGAVQPDAGQGSAGQGSAGQGSAGQDSNAMNGVGQGNMTYIIAGAYTNDSNAQRKAERMRKEGVECWLYRGKL